jgi:hypothetical protein
VFRCFSAEFAAWAQDEVYLVDSSTLVVKRNYKGYHLLQSRRRKNGYPTLAPSVLG